MAINARKKGKRNELLLAHFFQKYGFDARRSQQYCGMNGDADVVGVPYLHVECKAVQKLNLDKAMEQSAGDAREGEIPVVIHRKDRQDWRITMTLEDFMPFFMAYVEQQKGQSDG